MQLSRWDDCTTKTGGALLPPERFDIVVLRHGIADPTSAFDGLTPLAQPRQVLPYYITGRSGASSI